MRLTVAIVASSCALNVAHAVLPAANLITAPNVGTPAAATFYAGRGQSHSNGVAAFTQTPPEIAALARTLGVDRVIRGQQATITQYAQNAFDYVRNNVSVEFRFELAKGGRGALIDQSGTPFDQADLLAKLLGEARDGSGAIIPVTVNIGKITLTAQQFGQWTGLVNSLNAATQAVTVDAKSACQFLADGGIPADFGSGCSTQTGNLTTVTFLQPWIAAAGNSYDPSFKAHVLAAGIDIPSAMGCGTATSPTCGTSMTASAGGTAGTVSGFPSLKTMNTTALESWLTARATSVQGQIQNTNRIAFLQDIVGGRRLVNTSVTAGASLPYTLVSTVSSYASGIPDAYRATLRVRFLGGSLLGNAGGDQLFYADELAGRVLQLAATDQILLDFKAIPFTTCASCTLPSVIILDIDHPYAASSGAYGDDHAEMGMLGGDGASTASRGAFPVTIVMGWGAASPGTERHAADMAEASPTTWSDAWYLSTGCGTCLANNVRIDTSYENSDQPIQAAKLLNQGASSDQLVAGLASAGITRHHDFGVVYAYPYSPGLMSMMSVQSAVSVDLNATTSNATADANNRRAAFETMAATWAMLEGTDNQQLNNTDTGFSTASWFRTANDSNFSFIQLTAAQLAANPLTAAIGNAGYSEVTTSPGGAELFSRADSSANTIYGGSLKGAAALPTDPVSHAMETTRLVDAGAARKKYLSVSPSTGAATISQTDLITGFGDFPAALPFTRTYSSDTLTNQLLSTSNTISDELDDSGTSSNTTSYSTRYTGPDGAGNAHLGAGWTFNFNVAASYVGNAGKGFGRDSAMEASAAIAALYSFMDASRNPTFAGRVTSELDEFWLAKQVVYNTVVVEKGAAPETFTHLPDGSFYSPRGEATLVQSGQEGLARDFSPITFLYTGKFGDTISFDVASYSQYPVGSSNVKKIGAPVFKANTWTFADGTVVTFSYLGQTLVSSWPQATPIQCGLPGGCNNPPIPISLPFGSVLQSVSNNYGRSLTFTTQASTLPITNSSGLSYDHDTSAFRITRVTDENGRHVDFGISGCPALTYVDYSVNGTLQTPSLQNALFACTSLTVTSSDGNNVYTYNPGSDSPDPALTFKNNYRLRRWFTPAVPATVYRTLRYDGLFRVSSVTDRLGRVTSYRPGAIAGNENWKRGEADMPLGDAWTTIYGLRNSILASTDPLGNTTARTYDNAERQLTATQPEGDSVVQAYDLRSNVLSSTRHAKPSTGLADIVTSTTYGEGAGVIACANPRTCNRPILETDARGTVERNTWDPTTGLITRVETGLSAALACALASGTCPQTDVVYSSFGTLKLPTQRTDRISATQNLVTAFAYNAGNHLVLQSETLDPTGLNLTTGATFDALGNLTQVDGPRTDVTDVRNFTWDPMRRLTMSIDADPDGTGPLHRTATRYTYNADGLNTFIDSGTTTSAVGSDFAAVLTTGLLYDAEGNKTVQATPTGVTQYSYDSDDRALCTAIRMNPAIYASLPADACTLGTSGSLGADRISRNLYDGAGRLQTEQRAVGTALQQNYSTFHYTQNGQRDWSEDADGNRSALVYDGFDRLSQLQFPSATAGAHAANATDFEQYGYDPNGNRMSRRLRSTETINYSYDVLNRETLKDIPASTASDVFSDYDLLGHRLYAHYAAAGSISTDCSANSNGIDYCYDLAGRLLTETAFGRVLKYQYDQAGNRSRLTYPDTNNIQYTFDAMNRMVNVEENGATTGAGLLASYSYDTLGRRATLTRGNGTATTFAYLAPTTSFQAGTGLLQSLALAGTSQNLTVSLGYNPAAQLLTRGWTNNSYRYSATTSLNQTYVPNGLNEYSSVAGVTFSSDARGNLHSDGSRTFSYDLENRLLSVSGTASMTLSYDPLGRLQQDVAGSATTQFLYDGDRLTAEYDGAANLLRRYVHGAGTDEPLVWYEGAGLTDRRWLHTDQQGSVIAQTNSTGTATVYAYGPNGEPAGGNWTGSRFRYTGQIALNDAPALRLYHYKARVYDPYLGRFLQTDPIGYRDDLNLYAYVGNDPLDRTDPTGNWGEATAIGCAVTSEVGCFEGAIVGAIIDTGVVIGGAILIHKATEADTPTPTPSDKTAKANPDGKTITDSSGRVRGGSTGGPGAGKRIDPKTRESERKASGNKCIYCGRPTTNEPGKPNSSQGDHMQPKAGDRNGGPPGNNTPENTGNGCAQCNNEKSNQSLWQWVKGKFGMSGS